MGLKITREYGRVSLAGTPTLRTVIVRTGRFRDRWEYLRVECGEYVAGGYAGVVNATTADDLVILPKIPGVDFVGMFSRCAGGGQMTADRLESIIYRFPEGRLVYLDGVGMDFLREYLVLLLGILVIWIRRDGVAGIEGSLGVIGRFLETPFGISARKRLRESGLYDDVLCWRYDSREVLEEEECLKEGKVGAAARVISVIRYFDDHPAVMPFLVNMPLLFELYCLCLLRDGGRSEWFLYQKECKAGVFTRYPDILDRKRGIVIDCKYKPDMRSCVEQRDLEQMGFYAMMSDVRNVLDYQSRMSIDVLFLYPRKDGHKELRWDVWCSAERLEGFYRVRKLGVRLPVLACDYDGTVPRGTVLAGI